jgi:RNA polymerase sigma factor for flagellar operon FliA
MSTKELTQIWMKYQKKRDLKTRNKLILSYYYIVEKIASKLERKLNYKIFKEELASYGLDGLYEAIEKFDLNRNIKFETYATTRIRGSMIDALRKDDWVPRSVRVRFNNIAKKQSELELKLGRKVSEKEAVDKAGYCYKDFIKNSKKFTPMSLSSLDDYISDGSDQDGVIGRFNIFLQSNNVPSPDSKVLRKEFLNKLIGKNFSKKEKNIIYYHFYENLSMGEIAKKVDLSEPRVSQLLKGLVDRLKKRIELNPSYFEKDIIGIIEDCNDKDSLF